MLHYVKPALYFHKHKLKKTLTFGFPTYITFFYTGLRLSD